MPGKKTPKKPGQPTGTKGRTKPRGRPIVHIPEKAKPFINAMIGKGAGGGAACGEDLQDALHTSLGLYIEKKVLNSYVDTYRKEQKAQEKARRLKTEMIKNEPADDGQPDTDDKTYQKVEHLDEMYILAVEDYLRAGRSNADVRIALLDLAVDVTEEAIQDYRERHIEWIEPADNQAKYLAAARTLEQTNRAIRKQAIKIWARLPDKAKIDPKTYLALMKLSQDGQKVLIDTLRNSAPSQEGPNVDMALDEIEAKLGLDQPTDDQEGPQDVAGDIEAPSTDVKPNGASTSHTASP